MYKLINYMDFLYQNGIEVNTDYVQISTKDN